ncbi:hypothetical protein SAMD00019534_113520 [Acytostelium subglobosum LB1]|uniref:hypothetical protein n=1 Tax=Acytostelium subglobosum LB1 TaxID=1410327 RepID=UPI000644EFDB|nr:hypothetical protein SAMD00019534_113520 [Acytostelium subglobosum LB1]GAM28176.1 hypothetical protein SAMD00019534_113520 [Acytostelium subglobosum LB1]|eukprot:XP_012748810.1 hypothetical protein SAMD00019534_113520 [Acytostelium subglobosum LB1]
MAHQHPAPELLTHCISFDIGCPRLDEFTGYMSPPGQGTPANRLPPNHPDKFNTAGHRNARAWYFIQRIRPQLTAMGYARMQKSVYFRQCTRIQCIADALALRDHENTRWIPYCAREVHVLRLETTNSIYPELTVDQALALQEEEQAQMQIDEDDDDSDDNDDDEDTSDSDSD